MVDFTTGLPVHLDAECSERVQQCGSSWDSDDYHFLIDVHGRIAMKSGTYKVPWLGRTRITVPTFPVSSETRCVSGGPEKGPGPSGVGLTLNTHQVVAWFFPTEIRPKLKRRPMPFRFRVFADLLSKCATFGHRVACLSEAPSGLDAFNPKPRLKPGLCFLGPSGLPRCPNCRALRAVRPMLKHIRRFTYCIDSSLKAL